MFRSVDKRCIFKRIQFLFFIQWILLLLFLSTGCTNLESCKGGEDCYNLAKRYFDQNNYVEAIKNLNKIHDQNEELMARTYYTLGRCYKIIEQFDMAYRSYYRVYENFPTSNLADDALAMSGGMLYWQGRYKDALDTYVRFLKEYPHSDVSPVRVWESMQACLDRFKKEGGKYVYGDQVISADEFLNLALGVTEHRNTYVFLDRFGFWEEYSKKHESDHRFRLEYIQRLLEKENFLEAHRQINRLSKGDIPIAQYLEISKLYRLRKFEQVNEKSEQWLDNFKHKAPDSLVADCLILRIESLRKSSADNLTILNELNELFEFSRHTAFHQVLRIYPKINTEELLLLTKNSDCPPVVYFIVAQKYLDSGNFEKCQAYFRQGLSKMPTDEVEALKRGEVLSEILDILNGYYFSLSNEQFLKVLTGKFKRILNRSSRFNGLTKTIVSKYEKEINSLLLKKFVNAKRISDLLEYDNSLPQYLNEGLFVNSRTFQSIFYVLSNDMSWDEKVAVFPRYKIRELPTYTNQYYLNNFYYESIKFLYLVYVKSGFSKKTCNALFLQHLSCLNEKGIFAIYGDFSFDYGNIDDLPAYDYGTYYDRSNDRILNYHRVNSTRNKVARFKYNARTIIKDAIRKVKKRGEEYKVLSIYEEQL